MQDVVEKVLRKLNWQGKSLQAAGRTDAGVHATGQVIAFDLEWNHPAEELQRAMNAYLPPDVAAREVHLVPANFHPRRSALARRYHYHIFFSEVRDPLRERYAWRVWPSADAQTLSGAANLLVGKHDFTAFGTPPRAGSSTVRTVFQAEWRPDVSESGNGWLFIVQAEAFLYHMVRRMVSLQVEIGQGKYTAGALLQYLQAKEPAPGETPLYVQGLAPPNGLMLVEVLYPPGMAVDKVKTGRDAITN